MHPQAHTLLQRLARHTFTTLTQPTTLALQSPSLLYRQLPPPPPRRRHITRLAEFANPAAPAARIAADPTLNERIGPPNTPAHLVDASGSLLPAQPLATLLAQLDRRTEHLRRVGHAANGTPVCKVILEEQLVAQFRAAAEPPSRRDDPAAATKQVELTWAIAPNDLGYRLRRMQGFLREGRRVEVLIAPKRRGRRAEVEEARAVLKSVRGAVEEVEGAVEWKAMAGELGKQVELYFAGKGGKAREDETSKKTEERMKRKEAEEVERRAKEEKRKRRAEEREQRAKLAASL